MEQDSEQTGSDQHMEQCSIYLYSELHPHVTFIYILIIPYGKYLHSLWSGTMPYERILISGSNITCRSKERRSGNL